MFFSLIAKDDLVLLIQSQVQQLFQPLSTMRQVLACYQRLQLSSSLLFILFSSPFSCSYWSCQQLDSLSENQICAMVLNTLKLFLEILRLSGHSVSQYTFIVSLLCGVGIGVGTGCHRITGSMLQSQEHQMSVRRCHSSTSLTPDYCVDSAKP